MSSKDYYQILGVAENAPDGEIKSAFRKLAKTYHPDRNPGDREAEERFKEINEAYDVLSNPKKRRQYDQMRTLGAYGPFAPRQGGAGGSPFDFGGFGGPGGQRYTWTTIDDADLGGFGGLGDIFEELMRQMGMERKGWRRKRRPARRGQDINLSIEVPFDLAVRGGKLVVKVPGKVVCGACGGSGAAPNGRVDLCKRCKGKGTVAYELGGYALSRTCPECLGKGTRPDKPCPSCGGLGFSRGERKIGIRLPAGVGDKTKLKLAGRGDMGEGKAPAGDLYITIRVTPSEEFIRAGDNIHSTISIGVDEAILGTTREIGTASGKKVRLKIPPGSQPGKVFRLKGHGVYNERKKRSGDHLVKVEVKIPKKLTREQREFIEGFAREKV